MKFIKDSDPYEYNDTVEDEIKFSMDIYDMLRTNDSGLIIDYLKEFIEEGGKEEDIQKANKPLEEFDK